MVLLELIRSLIRPTLPASVSLVFAESEKASARAMASPLDRYCSVIVCTCLALARLESASVTESATGSMERPSFGRTRMRPLPVPPVLLAVLVQVRHRGRARLEREVGPGRAARLD